MPRIAAANGSGLVFDYAIGSFEEKTSFQTGTLKALLKGEQKYVGFTKEFGLVEFEKLYFCDAGGLTHIHHPVYCGDKDLLAGLRKSFLSSIESATTKRRIYVPRRHTRVVSNEDQLISLLKKYGFEIIDTDKLTFEQQVRVFSEAECVVAPHGAALTSLLFAPSDCKVMELYPPFGGSASFYLLSSAMNLDYSCYIDDISQGKGRDMNQPILINTSSIYVDIKFIESWLRGQL